ncbi:nitrile hydratase accessory protein [Microvirga sp. 0TCS3.31]
MAHVAAEFAPIPRGDDGEPVFRAPWEAQAFAMTLALYEQGLFTWTEWAASLSAAIKRAQGAGDCDDGSTYYQHWLTAIEQLVRDKGITTEQALAERRGAWDRAAHATPHGQPILLENDPLG